MWKIRNNRVQQFLKEGIFFFFFSILSESKWERERDTETESVIDISSCPQVLGDVASGFISKEGISSFTNERGDQFAKTEQDGCLCKLNQNNNKNNNNRTTIRTALEPGIAEQCDMAPAKTTFINVWFWKILPSTVSPTQHRLKNRHYKSWLPLI